jgi:hypothetical protein
VALSGIASNCTASSNPLSVNVPAGSVGHADFTVSCVAQPPPNQPPVVNAGPDDPGVVVGLLYSFTVSFTDPDGDGPWSYTIDWDDGSSNTTGTWSSQGSSTVSHTYVVPLTTHTIRVTVTDSHGASGSDTKVITVIL